MSSLSFVLGYCSEATAPPPVSCAYPLDASPAELAALGALGQLYSGPLMLSNGDQTGTYVIQSGLSSEEKYWALPSGFSAGTQVTADISAGTTVIQGVLSWETMTSAAGYANNQILIVDASFTPIAIAELDFRNSYDGFRLILSDASGTIYDTLDTALAVNSYELGFYFDAGAGTFAVRVGADSTPLVLTRNSYTPTTATLGMLADEGPGLDAGTAGKASTTTWRTSAADMTCYAAAGYTDICGNPL